MAADEVGLCKADPPERRALPDSRTFLEAPYLSTILRIEVSGFYPVSDLTKAALALRYKAILKLFSCPVP